MSIETAKIFCVLSFCAPAGGDALTYTKMEVWDVTA